MTTATEPTTKPPRKPRADRGKKRVLIVLQQQKPDISGLQWHDIGTLHATEEIAWAAAEKDGKPGEVYRVARVTGTRTVQTRTVLE